MERVNAQELAVSFQFLLHQGLLAAKVELLIFHFIPAHRTYTDCAHDCSAHACQDHGALQQKWVRIFKNVVLRQALLLYFRVGWNQEALVHSHVHLLCQDAVSRHTLTLVEQNDVANNQVPRWDLDLQAEAAAEDCGSLVLHLLVQIAELLFLPYVTRGLDKQQEQNSNINRITNCLAVSITTGQERDDERNRGDVKQELHEVVTVQSVLKDLPERLMRWYVEFVFAVATLIKD